MITRKVLILAAGSGSRLMPYTAELNKAVLPLDSRVVLDHILDNFDHRSEFVFSVGYRSEQIRGYIRANYPELNVRFVDVKPFDGPESSSGYSTFLAREYLRGSFYLVFADTLWNEPMIAATPDENWLGVSSVTLEESQHYWNVEIKAGRVTNFRNKTFASPEHYKAFVGLAHIKDWELFFASLKVSIANYSIENALEKLMLITGLGVREIPTWRDVGRRALYERELQKTNLDLQSDTLRDRTQ